jgi:hypothetical protein
MSLVEQELPTLPGHPSSSPVLGGCIAAQSVQCVIKAPVNSFNYW